MNVFKYFFVTILITIFAMPVSSDSLTAEFQTRLKLAGENPGKIDGAFGNKTNAAANSYFKTGNQNYRTMMSDANQTLIEDLKKLHIDTKERIFETTSDFIESENTTVFLEGENKIWEIVRDNFDEKSGGAISKWYQPDITGDGVPDLVFFGMGPDFQSECEIKKCNDDWLKKPVVFQLTNSTDSDFTDIKLLDQNTVFPGNIFTRGTGGKSIFADFNGDGFDDLYLPSEGPVKGSKKDTGGRDVLLISNGDGTYRDDAHKYDLLKKRSFQHWAAAGDIDNDGDVDFIFHNLKARTQMADRIVCFINDGDANFSVKDCVDAPNSKTGNKNNSWGGTLLDLNGDNFLDLWLSRNRYNSPVVILGDGSGRFQKQNSVEIYLPKDWPKVMKQFGYVVAADLEDDGYNEVFFSVQGLHEISPNDCSERKGDGYCGSYVGYFKNDAGFLKFAGFIKQFEKDFFIPEPMWQSKWNSSSMIVVKDIIKNDGQKDVFLKRYYTNPFFEQTATNKFEQTNTLSSSLLAIPNTCALQLSSCDDVDFCIAATQQAEDASSKEWKNKDFKLEAQRRGILCGVPKWK